RRGRDVLADLLALAAARGAGFLHLVGVLLGGLGGALHVLAGAGLLLVLLGGDELLAWATAGEQEGAEAHGERELDDFHLGSPRSGVAQRQSWPAQRATAAA